MQKSEVLDKLVQSGDIKGYSLETVEEVEGSGSRESEKLTLILPSGKFLVIDSVCSGFLENTNLMIESFDNIQFST